MAINMVSITGNVTREPELRNTTNGTPVMKIPIAINERRKNTTTGDYENYANFVECVLFGNYCNVAVKNIHVGSKISVSGRLHQDRWERDGQMRSKIEIVINELEWFAPKNDNGYYEEVPQVTPPPLLDEDIPF